LALKNCGTKKSPIQPFRAGAAEKLHYREIFHKLFWSLDEFHFQPHGGSWKTSEPAITLTEKDFSIQMEPGKKLSGTFSAC
jgi:hypothetical protein